MYIDKKNSKSITILNEGNKEIFRLSKEIQKNPYEKEQFKKILETLNNKYYKNRIFLPCLIEQYNHLRIKDTSFIPWVGSKGLSDFKFVPKMLSPYIKVGDKIEEYTNDKLFNWVYENRYYDDTTIENIKDSYDKFIEEFKEVEND